MATLWKALFVVMAGMGLSVSLVVGQAGDTGQTAEAPKQSATAPASVKGGPTQEKRVSAQFTDATFDEMLKWLASQGINFAAGHSSVDKSARISFSFSNAPIKDVMDAMAAAFGGHWAKKGEVYVFRAGPGVTTFDVKLPVGDWPSGAWNLRDFPKVLLKQRAESDADEMSRRTKLGQELKKMALELAEKTKKLQAEGKSEAEIEKALSAQIEALAAKAREMVKDAAKLREDLKLKPSKDGQFFLWSEPLIEDLKMPVLPKLEFEGKEWKWDVPQLQQLRGGLDAQQLIESVTDEQWKKHESKGYLTPADLTPKQRELLGSLHGDRWEIQIAIGSKKLTIKNE